MESAHAAVENEKLWAFFAQTLQLRSFKGGGFTEHPRNNAGLNGLVADRVEWFVHKDFKIGI